MIRLSNPARVLAESSIFNRRYRSFYEADQSAAIDAGVADDLLDQMEELFDKLEDALDQETRASYTNQGITPDAAKVKMYQKLEKLKRRSDRLDKITHDYHSKLNRMDA